MINNKIAERSPDSTSDKSDDNNELEHAVYYDR